MESAYRNPSLTESDCMRPVVFGSGVSGDTARFTWNLTPPHPVPTIFLALTRFPAFSQVVAVQRRIHQYSWIVPNGQGDSVDRDQQTLFKSADSATIGNVKESVFWKL